MKNPSAGFADSCNLPNQLLELIHSEGLLHTVPWLIHQSDELVTILVGDSNCHSPRIKKETNEYKLVGNKHILPFV